MSDVVSKGALPSENELNAFRADASNGYRTSVWKFLDTYGAFIDAQDEGFGRTALMMAACWGHTEIVQLLLEKGADITLKNHNGDTALMWAEKNNHVEVAAFLRQWTEAKHLAKKTQQELSADRLKARLNNLRRHRPQRPLQRNKV